MAGRTQVFFQDDWLKKLNITQTHSGNVVMDDADVSAFSNAVDLDALKVYRLAVGHATREAVSVLGPDDVLQKVSPARLEGLLEDGSVLPEAMGLIEYWGSLTVAGLLLMPPTRHCLVHLNEAIKVKKRCMRLQFD